jgi:hypothetical protein
VDEGSGVETVNDSISEGPIWQVYTQEKVPEVPKSVRSMLERSIRRTKDKQFTEAVRSFGSAAGVCNLLIRKVEITIRQRH